MRLSSCGKLEVVLRQREKHVPSEERKKDYEYNPSRSTTVHLPQGNPLLFFDKK